MAASHVSNDPKQAVSKLSLPEGLWEWILIGFPMVLHGFWGSLASPWPHGSPWPSLGAPLTWKQMRNCLKNEKMEKPED